MKNQYRGRDCLKRGTWTVCQFKGSLATKMEGVFLRGVDTPMHTIPTAFKHTGLVCSLFDCCFAITLCNNTLHLLYLDRFFKRNPSSTSIFLMRLKFS